MTRNLWGRNLPEGKKSAFTDTSRQKKALNTIFDRSPAPADDEPSPEAYERLFKVAAHVKDSQAEQHVYHCTTMERARSIQKDGFRFPIKGVTENRGWKLGYAVYFGVDPNYCVSEAMNTFEDEGTKPGHDELAMLRVTVVKGRCKTFGDYKDLDKRSGMSREELDEVTENICSKCVEKFSVDTIHLNDGLASAEVVVYHPKAIKYIEVLPASQFLKKK